MRVSHVLARGVAGIFLLIQGCALPTGQPGAAADPGTTPAASGPLSSPLAGALPGSTPSAPAPTPGGTPGSTPAGTPGTPGATPGSFAELDAWPGGKLPPDQFFRMIAPAVIASSKQTGVPAAVTMAQAALETGYGGSTIGDAKNLFGMKGSGPAGSIDHETREVINGQSVTVTAQFRKYNTWLESIIDHDQKLSTNSRYAGAMAVKDNPEEFARKIHEAGYATDPSYSDQLIRIMRQYNLTSLGQA